MNSQKRVTFGSVHQMTAGSMLMLQHAPVGNRRDSTASSISVDDIMAWADETRAKTSIQSRRNTLEMIQSYMFRDPKRITRPQTCKERRLPQRERPLTARSLCSEPPPPVTTPVAFPLANDEEGFGGNEQSEENTLLSQQCCELLGPTMCQMCAKKVREHKLRTRYEHNFRSLRVSEENFTTTALVKKNMPYLSFSEAQDQVAAGAVSQQQLRRLNQIRYSPRELEKRKIEREYEEAAFTTRKPQSTYSLREMNRRLAAGETGFRKKKQGRLSVTESLFPSFVSPRKVKQYDEPLFKVYYEPPLVAKHRQKSEPTFFAGSSFDYKLPDRLPDKIIFTKIVKETSTIDEAECVSFPPAEPLDYEATYIDSVDNLIKEHLDRH